MSIPSNATHTKNGEYFLKTYDRETFNLTYQYWNGDFWTVIKKPDGLIELPKNYFKKIQKEMF